MSQLRFPTFAAVFQSLVGEPPEKHQITISEEAVLGLINKYASAATREVVDVLAVQLPKRM